MMRCMPKGHTTMGALRACRFEGVSFSECEKVIYTLNSSDVHGSPGTCTDSVVCWCQRYGVWRGAGAFRADVGGFKVLCAFTGRPQLECGRWDARIQPKRR